jgi:hypothetical protein
MTGFWISQGWLHHSDPARTLRFWISGGTNFWSGRNAYRYWVEGHRRNSDAAPAPDFTLAKKLGVSPKAVKMTSGPVGSLENAQGGSEFLEICGAVSGYWIDGSGCVFGPSDRLPFE